MKRHLLLGASAARIFAAGSLRAFSPHVALEKPEDGGLAAFTTAFEKFQQETLEKIEKAAGDSTAIRAELHDLQQKMVRRMKVGGDASEESWGQQFIKDENSLTALHDAHGINKNAKHRVMIKSVSTGITGGTFGPVARDPAIETVPRRRLTIRNLLTVIPTEQSSVEYVAQTSRTNAAGMVAEGGAKPESDIAFELRTTNAKVIAHWIKASKQVLSDVQGLRALIDSELIDGVREKEEQQILSGDGTGQNLTGLVPSATAYSAPIVIENTNLIDVIGMALLQSSLARFPANGVVLHPSDWMRIRLIKDADGKYVLGDPGAEVSPVLFGRPVVESEGMTPNKFLVGDFKRAARLYDRWQPIVEAGFVDDDFTRNMVTLLGEERVALAIRQSGALIYGDFDAALAS